MPVVVAELLAFGGAVEADGVVVVGVDVQPGVLGGKGPVAHGGVVVVEDRHGDAIVLSGLDDFLHVIGVGAHRE